jgi:hypothetical protein
MKPVWGIISSLKVTINSGKNSLGRRNLKRDPTHVNENWNTSCHAIDSSEALSAVNENRITQVEGSRTMPRIPDIPDFEPASVLTFIIPVRHPSNAKDWSSLKRRLGETIRSVEAQDSSRWNAIIVANSGSDLPTLPKNFYVAWVDFPPNALHEQGNAERELFYEAIRADKGRRILAGMLHAKRTGHIMIVDDDDFVSCKLASYVEANAKANGWYVDRGYLWEEGGGLLYLLSNFHRLCGSSHIVRSDLYEIPSHFDEASETYIRRMLGSHVFIEGYLASNGNPLHPLPFPGAVYRIGHAGSHSKSKGIRGQLINRRLLKHPVRFLLNLWRLSWISADFREEFFGGSDCGD